MSFCATFTPSELRSVITREFWTVSPETAVVEAIAQMSACRLRDNIIQTANEQLDNLHFEARATCILVVEADRVIGILTERDILRLNAERQPLDGLMMQQVMVSPIITLRESALTDLFSAIDLLQRHHISRLPIVDEQDRLVGLVTYESLRHVALTRQKQRSQQQEAVIAEMALRIRQHVGLEDIANAIVQEVQKFLEADRVVIYQFNSDMSGIVIAEAVVQPWISCLNRPVIDTCFQENLGGNYQQGRVFAANDVYTANLTDCHLQLLEQFQVRANLVVPILLNDKRADNDGTPSLWGLLIAHQCSGPRAWETGDIQLLQQLSVQLAIALQQAELYQSLQTLNASLEQQVEARTQSLQVMARKERIVANMVTQIRASLDLQGILETTVREVRASLQCDRVNIWQFENDEHLTIVAESTDSPQSLIGEQIHGNYLQSRIDVYCQGQIRVVSDIYATEMSDGHREMLAQLQIRAKVLMPLFCGDTLWGVLNASESQHTRDWQPAEIDLVQALSKHLAIALQQATTYEQLQAELRQREQTEALLADSEQRYAALVETAPVGIFRTDAVGHCTYVNDCCCQLVGLPLETVLGRGWEQGLHPEDRDWVTTEWDASIRENRPFQLEYRFQTSDGRVTWVKGQTIAERDRQGQVTGYVGSLTDISDRKQAEEALRISEERYRSIYDQSVVGFVGSNLEGQFLHANPYFCQLLGYTREELLAKTVAEVTHPEHQTQIRPAMQSLFAGEIPHFTQEKRYRRKDGTFFWGLVCVSLLRNAANQPIGTAAVVQDISDRKRIELALEESEQRFRTLFESTPQIAVQGYDRHHRVIYWNQASEQFYGYTQTEALGHPLEDLIVPPEMQSWLSQAVQAWMDEGQPILAGELSLMRQDGSRVSVFSSHVMLTNSAGEPEMYRVDIDLSGLKQAEAALKVSEVRWQFALEGAGDGVWDANPQTRTVFYSQQWKTMLGYADHEVGHSWEDWDSRVHPDDRAKCYAALNRHLNGEVSIYEQEHRLRCRDGSYKWILARGQVIEQTPEGDPLRIIGTHTDISDRKQAETALHKLIEGTAATTGEDFFPALVQYVGEALQVSYAVVTEERDGVLYTLAVWAEGTVQPNFSYRSIDTPCERTLQEGLFSCTCSLQQQFPDSPDLNLAEMGVDAYLGIALYDTQGQPVGNLCILDDGPIPAPQWAEQILRVFAARAAAELERQRSSTLLEQLNQQLEVKIAERTLALQEREIRYRALVEVIPDLMIRLRADGQYLDVVSGEWVKPFNPGQFRVGVNIYDVTPLDHAQERMFYVQQALETREVQVYDYDVIIEGEPRAEQARIVAINEAEVLVIVQDITQRKQAEIALSQSQQFLQTVLDTFPLYVFWKDRQSIYLGCNEKFAEAAGLSSPEEIIGKTDDDMPWALTEANRYRADDLTVIQSAIPKLGIMETQRQADGSQIWLETNKLPLYDVDHQVIGVLGTYQDITDRKATEKALMMTQSAVDLAVESVFLVRSDSSFYYVNEAACNLLGYSREELLNLSVLDID
ncbi:MAG: PAS domain S-box protein, partial [Leptolyngbya sp. SIO1D8]|nr:PAS domain S-box protein [Leptolyngbya sp. SIO1D8]